MVWTMVGLGDVFHRYVRRQIGRSRKFYSNSSAAEIGLYVDL